MAYLRHCDDVPLDRGRRIRLCNAQLASLRHSGASVLYEFSADAYERIKADNPALSQALLTYVVRVMAERLSFANRFIGVLKR